ncbi:MAG: lamin tail domain-containing protein [Myxococcales bacterium]|nr:MAG: lamin tail domain-containing protein [Myxococcales bacterium]
MLTKPSRWRVSGVALLLAGAPVVACSASDEPLGTRAQRVDTDSAVVIRQVYGGGSNAGAPFTHDFIELFNRSSAPVTLSGYSLQYASATGTGNLGATATQLTELPTITLAPGQSYLVQEAGGAVGAPLTADFIDASPIALSATAGKVALVQDSEPVGCNGGSSPCSAAQLAAIVDLVGYGGANFSEGSAAPAASNSTAVSRVGEGCQDRNDNSLDFVASAPAPRASGSPATECEPNGGTGGSGGGGAGSSGASSGGSAGSSGAGGSGGGAGGGTGMPGPLRIRDIQR